MVSLSRSDGIVGLFERRYVAGPPGLHQIAPFPLLDRTCHPEALLAGAQEGVAEAIHARFQEEQLASGHSPVRPASGTVVQSGPGAAGSPTGTRPRPSGTSCARSAVTWCPRPGWEAGVLHVHREPDRPRLARQEHERWRAERTVQGWRLRRGAGRGGPARKPRCWSTGRTCPGTPAPPTAGWSPTCPSLLDAAGYRIVRLRAGAGRPGDWVEAAARAIHEQYLSRRAEDGRSAAASARPWAELDPALQDSNRAQAANIATKLASIGCHVVPAARARGFDGLSSSEVEELSRQEHDRWVDERRGRGLATGRLGPPGSPDIVAWDDLGDDRRELDREAVLAIPDVLSAAELGIAREPSSERVADLRGDAIWAACSSATGGTTRPPGRAGSGST